MVDFMRTPDRSGDPAGDVVEAPTGVQKTSGGTGRGAETLRYTNTGTS